MRHLARTPLMPHQKDARAKAQGRKGFAYLMEQGTGKSLTALDEALELYADGEIDGVCVLAPNGVHENWVYDELPKHLPPDMAARVAAYVNDPNRREKAALAHLMAPREPGDVPPMRWLAISYDSLLTERGFDFAVKFVRAQRTLLIADESQKIKTLTATRSKRALTLRRFAEKRRILTGTAITNSPLDAFAQFEFLEEGMLGTDSFVEFRAEYCELLSSGHGMVKHIVQKMERKMGRQMSDREREKRSPSIIAKDERGMPIYKNLDRLNGLIAPHSFRVLKEDVLTDLPPKQFEVRYFHLTKTQRQVYERMEDEQRFILEDQSILAVSKLVAMSKLRQITSGFLLMRSGEISYLEDNPRIELLVETVEDFAGKGIIWAFYKEEIRNIIRRLNEAGHSAKAVNGDTPLSARREIREEFQNGPLQWIVAHPLAMGTGYTLTAAEWVIYYSNDFSLEGRLQSEDRAHRIGQTKSVLYTDFVALDTRDDDIAWALQQKLDVAAIVNGDPERKSRFRASESYQP